MIVLLRYRDLKARGIVASWAQLKRLQDHYGFPLGRMLSPNTRVWSKPGLSLVRARIRGRRG
jgi:hypothetical protein